MNRAQKAKSERRIPYAVILGAGVLGVTAAFGPAISRKLSASRLGRRLKRVDGKKVLAAVAAAAGKAAAGAAAKEAALETKRQAQKH